MMHFNKVDESGKPYGETDFPHIVLVRKGICHCLICDVDIPYHSHCLERHSSGEKHKKKLEQQELKKKVENNNENPKVSFLPQNIPEINKRELYCENCRHLLPCSKNCLTEEEKSNYENEGLENTKNFHIESSMTGVQKSNLRNKSVSKKSPINTPLNRIFPRTEIQDVIFMDEIKIPTKPFISYKDEQSKVTPSANLPDFALSDDIEMIIQYTKEDLLILEKFKSITPNEKEILELKQFVEVVENAIYDLKNQLYYSPKLFDVYQNKNSLFTNEKFDNLISDFYRLDALGTDVFLSKDFEFRIAIVLNPILKPTKFVFGYFYDSLESIINKKYKPIASIFQTEYIFCFLSDLRRKYKIEILLASTSWNNVRYNPQVCYLKFGPTINMQIFDIIKLCKWFRSLSHDSHVLKILATLTRNMSFSSNQQNKLSFWASVFIAAYAINYSPHLCGPSRNLRMMFFILSSGILLSEGECLTYPLALSNKFTIDLKHEDVLEIKDFSTFSLRSISEGNLSIILNYFNFFLH